MQITFLGTGAAAPTRWRNVSSLALRLPERGATWLFDCGEGTQHQIIQTDLKIARIDRIFITHLHGDHLYGLFGMLASRGGIVEIGPIDLYGPPGLARFVRAGLEYSYIYLGYEVRVHEVEAGIVVEDEQITVRCLPLQHRVPTVGYRVEERDRPGAFDAEAAAALGVPFGPLFGRLKLGERVRLPDGREVDGTGLIRPPEPGRALAYCTDTGYCAESVELARDADLLIHEATFAQRDADLAGPSAHSTATDAARVAREAGARKLILTHLSARYPPDGEAGPEQLLTEARAIFPNTELAEDFLRVEVPRRRRGQLAPLPRRERRG